MSEQPPDDSMPEGNDSPPEAVSGRPFPDFTSCPPHGAPKCVLPPTPPRFGRERPFFIRSELNNQVLDINGGNSSPGTAVIVWPRKPAKENNQLWYCDEGGVIRSMLNDFAMDSSGGMFKMQPYEGRSTQTWIFAGNKIVNPSFPSDVLDIHNGNNGSAALSRPYNNQPNQHFVIDYQGQSNTTSEQPPDDSMPVGNDSPPEAVSGRPFPYFTSCPPHGAPKCVRPPTPPRFGRERPFFIRSELNNQVLDINGGNSSPGISVIVWPRKPAKEINQLWYFDEGDVIRSMLNDFAMDSSGGMFTMQPYEGRSTQTWQYAGNKIVNSSFPSDVLDMLGGSGGVAVFSLPYNEQPNQHFEIDYV